MENDKPEFLALLDTHINFSDLIPGEFTLAFYRRYGRPRGCTLVSFIKFLVLQKTLGIDTDSAMLTILRVSRELREFCEFETVPDASKITRFKQDFVEYLQKLFDNLVELTEPICHELDAKKSGVVSYPCRYFAE